MKLGFSEKIRNTKGCCEARVDVNNQRRRVGEGERRGGGIHTKAEAIDCHQLLVNHDDPHRGSDIEKPCSNIQSCFPVCFACRVPIRLPNNRGCHLLLPPPPQPMQQLSKLLKLPSLLSLLPWTTTTTTTTTTPNSYPSSKNKTETSKKPLLFLGELFK